MAMQGKKPDFMSSVVDDMPAPDDGEDYGAKMSDETDEGDPEEADQDRALAAKSILKSIESGDSTKLADALKAFVSSCM